MTAHLIISALNMALFTRKPSAVIHYSDQGSQYTSIEFGKRRKEMGVQPSMGSIGDAYDNAMAERLEASLECELVNRRTWKTKTEARLAVFLHGSNPDTTRYGVIPDWDIYRLSTLKGE